MDDGAFSISYAGSRLFVVLARTTAALVAFAAGTEAAAGECPEEFQYAGYADEEVDDGFDRWPRADQHVHDIQVFAHEHAETDEAPVQCADDDE